MVDSSKGWVRSTKIGSSATADVATRIIKVAIKALIGMSILSQIEAHRIIPEVQGLAAIAASGISIRMDGLISIGSPVSEIYDRQACQPCVSVFLADGLAC